MSEKFDYVFEILYEHITTVDTYNHDVIPTPKMFKLIF